MTCVYFICYDPSDVTAITSNGFLIITYHHAARSGRRKMMETWAAWGVRPMLILMSLSPLILYEPCVVRVPNAEYFQFIYNNNFNLCILRCIYRILVAY